jgi:cyanophycinase
MDLSHFAHQAKGYLMPIGGAEDKISQRLVLNRFVQRCGGSNASLVVIPTASSMSAESGSRYCKIFSELGARHVECLNIQHRHEANDPANSALLDNASGVFLTGGDQVRLVAHLGGTLLGDKLSACFASGLTVGGTSAGASALSQHMIAYGRSGASPSQRMVQLSPGLGLTTRITIDQHFRQRDRLGRLMTAVAFNPSVIGMGLDEDTAVVISPDNTCEVIGSGSVTVVDGSQLEYTDIYSVKGHGPIATLGMKLHVLTSGYRYHLESRQPEPPMQTTPVIKQ